MTELQQVSFDPEHFAKDFFSRVAKNHRSVRDVFFLNILFMWQRGRKDRTHFNSTPDAEELIAYLKSVYEIKDDDDHFLEEDSVTLERIHLAFPTVGCKAAAVGVEQRKATSQLDKVMAIIECPAFARFCSSLVEFGGNEGLLFVDAHCWAQYLHARKEDPENEPNLNKIRRTALAWRANFSLDDLAEIFEQKLSMIKNIDDLMLDESNVKLGVAELHRSLRGAASIPNVNFIVDQAIYEEPFDFKASGEANETFLNNYEVLYFSGALLCYLTSIKKRLCRDNRLSHERFASRENQLELFNVLREAAVALLNSTPDDIIQLMTVAGLRVSWGEMMYAAHDRVSPLIRSLLLIDLPKHASRLDIAELGLKLTFAESTLFQGCYPNLIKKWATAWRRVYVEDESALLSTEWNAALPGTVFLERL